MPKGRRGSRKRLSRAYTWSVDVAINSCLPVMPLAVSVTAMAFTPMLRKNTCLRAARHQTSQAPGEKIAVDGWMDGLMDMNIDGWIDR